MREANAIGGLCLPPDLVAALRAGIWRAPADSRILAHIFHEEPEFPEFYDIDAMRRDNAAWRKLPAAEAFGIPVPGRSLGIDTRRSVLIADLGPDRPVALDYRVSRDQPRVLYLGFDGLPVWTEVAPDFRTLWERLQGTAGQGKQAPAG